jgi:hypothetical protein
LLQTAGGSGLVALPWIALQVLSQVSNETASLASLNTGGHFLHFEKDKALYNSKDYEREMGFNGYRSRDSTA